MLSTEFPDEPPVPAKPRMALGQQLSTVELGSSPATGGTLEEPQQQHLPPSTSSTSSVFAGGADCRRPGRWAVGAAAVGGAPTAAVHTPAEAFSVRVDKHRTTGSVTEYGVCSTSRWGHYSLRWHRFSAFALLHERIASSIGLPAEFPCSKYLLVTGDRKAARAAELQAWLETALDHVGWQPLPPELREFLLDPETSGDRITEFLDDDDGRGAWSDGKGAHSSERTPPEPLQSTLYGRPRSASARRLTFPSAVGAPEVEPCASPGVAGRADGGGGAEAARPSPLRRARDAPPPVRGEAQQRARAATAFFLLEAARMRVRRPAL